MSTFAFAGIWEKLNNRDPDIKYVGCGDLLIELQKESFKFDKQQEKLLGDKLLDLLTGESSIGDVRSQAQTCIGPFVAKASDEQIKNMTDKLADFLMEEKVKDEQREISSYGLQTVIHSVNPRCGNLLVDRLARRIMGVLQNESTSPEVKGECMDRLVDLLARFGSIMGDLHADIVQIALAQLKTHRQNCRKKATGCLARVAVYLDDKLFSQLIETLVQCENNNPTGKHWYIRSCISTIKEISQSAGQRLSSFLPHVVPLLLRLCEGEADMRDSTSDTKHDEELREICFQTFESLNTRCPKDLPVHIPQIIGHAVYSLKFDPNYIGDEDEFPNDEEFPEEDNPFGDSVDDAGFEDAGQDWEEIQQEFDDDEQLDSDMSWKVRKAAAKIIGSILKNRPEMLEELYEIAIPALISRLKSEREEHVMLEVFQSLTYALRQTHKATTLQHKGPENQLRKLLPDTIHNITVALSPDKVKSPKWAQVRVGIFTLLKEILLVQEGTNANAATPGLTSSNSNNIVISRSERLDEQIGKHPDFPALMAAVVSALADKSSNLRIETLVFLRLLLQNLSAESFHPFIESLAPAIFDSVANNYYKIVAEALRVCAALVTVLRPLDHEVKFNYRPYAASIYESILSKLQAKDIDQEVKTAAITCAANIIATLGDCLPQQYLHDSLHILQDRLQNEITRLTTVRVLAKIAESPLNIQLDPILGESISRLASFLRQNNRQLRQSSLVTLDILIKHYGSNSSIPELLPALLTEVAGLVSAADLHLSHLALQLSTTVLSVHPNVATGLIKDLIFPRTLDLIESKVLQGLALQSLLNLLGELVRNDTAGFGFDDLLRSLLQLANQNDDLAKQSTTSVAQCIAALCVNTRSEQQLRQTVQSFIRKVSGKSETKDVVLSLLSLGEIGRRVDLSANEGLQNVIFQCFDAQEESVKSAASFALGSIAVGNLDAFLPFILNQISSSPDKQYMLLHSLREVITRHSSAPLALQSQLDIVLGLLFDHCQSERDTVRNVVAECLGRLAAVIKPQELITSLQQRLRSDNKNVRATVVTALKFTLADATHDSVVDKCLQQVMGDFLDRLNDEEHTVRHATLLTFNYAAHNRPMLILASLDRHLPVVYKETLINESLIVRVPCGPFIHVIDHGLENRKAAYECMYTLMETCLERLDIQEFLKHLAGGLKDDSADIKTMCHIMLEHLTQSAGSAVLRALDELIPPMEDTLSKPPKDTSVKQEKERYDELVRSTLRAVLAINRIHGAENSAVLNDFMNNVVARSFSDHFRALQEGKQSERMDLSR